VQLTDPAGDAWLADSVKSTDGRAKNVDIIAADIRRGSRFLRVRIDYQALGPRASRQWGVRYGAGRSDRVQHDALQLTQ
jgi:hypothetical protein